MDTSAQKVFDRAGIVRDAQAQSERHRRKRKRKDSSKSMDTSAQKVFDRADIVREFRLRDFHDRSLSRGQSSPDALGRSAGVIPFRFFAACMLASRPWFLFQIEPDFHLLSQTSEWSSQKIEFVFSCQSRN